MTTNEPTAEKRIVEKLHFGPQTAKRVRWEAWEFTVVGPHQVEVTNASYGAEKADHAYIVGIDTHDGVVVPSECTCPADVHREPDCKHKVALATVGSATVLTAAVEYEPAARALSDTSRERMTTGAQLLQTDGGTVRANHASDPTEDTCPNGEPWCPGPDGAELPCFNCFNEHRERNER